MKRFLRWLRILPPEKFYVSMITSTVDDNAIYGTFGSFRGSTWTDTDTKYVFDGVEWRRV